MLFDSFEAYDVQETRRISREEGRQEGAEEKLVVQVCKKLKKNYKVPEIAEMLEEEELVIQRICDVAEQFAPDYNITEILKKLRQKKDGSLT